MVWLTFSVMCGYYSQSKKAMNGARLKKPYFKHSIFKFYFNFSMPVK